MLMQGASTHRDHSFAGATLVTLEMDSLVEVRKREFLPLLFCLIIIKRTISSMSPILRETRLKNLVTSQI